MKMSRVWEMPNSKTFKIKAIRNLITRYAKAGMKVVDPFANEHSIKEHLTETNYISNDLDPIYGCDYNMEAGDFLSTLPDSSVDMILYDPPHSPRQVKEVYTKLERTVNMTDTQQSYWSNFKRHIARVLKPNGVCISFGWNSGGIGKTNGMELLEIMLVAHGGGKNDTIVTVEKKIKKA